MDEMRSWQGLAGINAIIRALNRLDRGVVTVPSGVNQLTGDVTAGPGSGSLATTIANSAVTLAKIANAAGNSKLVGSGATGSGSPYSEITLGTNLSMSSTTLNASSTGFFADVIAATDQDVSSSTAVANDNELFFTMTAGKVYAFQLFAAFVSPVGGGTPDFKFAFNGPATLTGLYTLESYLTTADAVGQPGTGTLTTASGIGTATTPRLAVARGWASSSAGGVGSSGFILQWAQNTSSSDLTRRLAGSVLQYRQIN